jgi:hypothetical protein
MRVSVSCCARICHQQPNIPAGTRLSRPKTAGISDRLDRLDKHIRPDGESLAATGINLGGLKMSNRSGLSESIDPNRRKQWQITG